MAVLRESPWYDEIEQRGILLGKLASVPILAQLGLSVEEIDQRLDLSSKRVA